MEKRESEEETSAQQRYEELGTEEKQKRGRGGRRGEREREGERDGERNQRTNGRKLKKRREKNFGVKKNH